MSFLFDYHIAYQSNCRNHTRLPFQIFGMSQQGSSHSRMSIGNQDAASVFIGKNLLIGIVADGCSQGSNVNAFSFNQVGAQIACNLNTKVMRRLITRQRFNTDQFKQHYNEKLLLQYKRLFNGFSPWKHEKGLLLTNMFSSTFIAFVITPDFYMVFHYGDGNAYVNSIYHRLSPPDDPYFTNRILNGRDNRSKIKFLQTGKTKDLNNLLISTDGFLEHDQYKSKFIKDFFFKEKPLIHQVGFVDRKMDFRVQVVDPLLKKETNIHWPSDDATFLSLRRVRSSK